LSGVHETAAASVAAVSMNGYFVWIDSM